MNRINIGKKEIIHFVGIGGIGMSGLAQIMKTMGFNVQGSDLYKNKNTENCKKLGIKIILGHLGPICSSKKFCGSRRNFYAHKSNPQI